MNGLATKCYMSCAYIHTDTCTGSNMFASCRVELSVHNTITIIMTMYTNTMYTYVYIKPHSDETNTPPCRTGHPSTTLDEIQVCTTTVFTFNGKTKARKV